MKIVLVRHGQTPANTAGALDTIRPGLPLTPLGQEQAHTLAQHWDKLAPAPTHIITSGLKRTRQTAAPLAQRYQITPRIDPRIRELRSGDIEMNADAPSQHTYIRTTLAWCAGDLDLRMPGGENGREAVARALEAIRTHALRAREEKGTDTVAVFVIHGALTRLLATWLTHNISVPLVSAHFMSNTGTVLIDWPDTFTPANADELAHQLTALTWNDRPITEWDY